MLCSILIPSRGRPDRLLKTIQSIIDSAADPKQFEFLIRVDEDEKTKYIDAIGSLPLQTNIWQISGRRKDGWYSIHEFYDELADTANDKWIWIMNDDATVSCWGEKKWDEQLAEIKTKGFIVYPEVHKLNESTYVKDAGGAFPILPNKCWKKYKVDSIPKDCDKSLYELLLSHGWAAKFLSGVTAAHERDSDEQLNEHRKL
jgi:hypothetical protein